MTTKTFVLDAHTCGTAKPAEIRAALVGLSADPAPTLGVKALRTYARSVLDVIESGVIYSELSPATIDALTAEVEQARDAERDATAIAFARANAEHLLNDAAAPVAQPEGERLSPAAEAIAEMVAALPPVETPPVETPAPSAAQSAANLLAVALKARHAKGVAGALALLTLLEITPEVGQAVLDAVVGVRAPKATRAAKAPKTTEPLPEGAKTTSMMVERFRKLVAAATPGPDGTLSIKMSTAAEQGLVPSSWSHFVMPPGNVTIPAAAVALGYRFECGKGTFTFAPL